MKFIVAKKVLLDAATAAGKCVSTNAAMPILGNFLFSLAEGKLTVTATDLQTTLSAVITVEGQGDGVVAVPAGILLDVLKALPEQPIRFTSEDGTNAIEIIAGEGSFKLAGDSGDNFPKVPVVESPSHIELPASALAAAIGKTLFAVSNDELRPAMTGVLCYLSPNAITFVATDAHKLVRYTRTDISVDAEAAFIIPKKALALLKGSLPVSEAMVAVDYNKTSAFFSFGSISVVCRLIDERYPDYEAILPKESPNVMKIDRYTFLNTLQRVAIFANRTTHQVKLGIAENRLTITAEDSDFSNEAKDIGYCQYTGEPMAIAFSHKILAEVLKNTDTDLVALQMSTANKAALLVPVDGEENEDLLMLLMPLMLNE